MSGTVIILLIAAAATLATGVYLWLRARPTPEEPLFHFNCPHCRRKLRYRLKQAGHQGACPRCKQALLFPPVSGKTSPGH